MPAVSAHAQVIPSGCFKTPTTQGATRSTEARQRKTKRRSQRHKLGDNAAVVEQNVDQPPGQEVGTPYSFELAREKRETRNEQKIDSTERSKCLQWKKENKDQSKAPRTKAKKRKKETQKERKAQLCPTHKSKNKKERSGLKKSIKSKQERIAQV